jgi:hypothetical protein
MSRATLNDERLTSSFKQGFLEGAATSGAEVTFKVTVSSDGVDLSITHFRDAEEALTRVRHYLSENNVGVVVTLSVEAGAFASESADDDDIIDAEVVEPPSQADNPSAST